MQALPKRNLTMRTRFNLDCRIVTDVSVKRLGVCQRTQPIIGSSTSSVVGRRSSVVRRRADQVNVPLTSSALRCPFCLGRRRTLWTVSIDRADLHVAEPLTVPDRRELLPASDIAGGAVTPRALGPPRARQGPPRCPYTTPPVGPRSSAECVDDDAHERPACPRWQEGQIGDQSRFGRSR